MTPSTLTLTELNTPGYERVVKAEDSASGLRAIIAIHNTNLGPAVGGTRLYPYTTEEEALTDALRLSKGMTYKSSLAGLPFGGGKSVIIADPEDKTPQLMLAFARFVDTLKGQYICAEDMNTNTADMEVVRTLTPHVAGLERDGGDPSPFTALGVFSCIEATAKKLGIPLTDLRVAVQGIGSVGRRLIEQLSEAGCTVYVADSNGHKVNEVIETLGVKGVHPDNILFTECDILSPCAMGAVLNDNTIGQLRCRAVVGAANNQLAEPRHARRLQDLDILYAPDYLVNAGGITNIAIERQMGGYNMKDAVKASRGLGQRLLDLYAYAEEHNMTTAEAADRLAEQRFLNSGK